ncbi:hypothetical protein [Roseivirga pacifica]|jgi:hypothetical protein|uniref:hypothetical protein n=1 Tax=Roseivirga pacifica TaxID=1267423 RepID=UPI003BA99E2B
MKISDKLKNQLLKEFDTSLTSYTQTLDRYRLMLEQISQFQKLVADDSVENLKKSLNSSGILLVGYLDCYTSLKGILNATEAWEQIFFTRTLRLTIHEVVKSYSNHTDEMRKVASKMTQEIQLKLKASGNLLRQFRKKYNYNKDIQSFRNNVIGHISSDFASNYDIFKGIDINHSAIMAKDFIHWLDSALSLFHSYMEYQKANDQLRFLEVKSQMSDIDEKLRNFNGDASNPDYQEILSKLQMLKDSLNT